jgi:hypothetical protein
VADAAFAATDCVTTDKTASITDCAQKPSKKINIFNKRKRGRRV